MVGGGTTIGPVGRGVATGGGFGIDDVGVSLGKRIGFGLPGVSLGTRLGFGFGSCLSDFGGRGCEYRVACARLLPNCATVMVDKSNSLKVVLDMIISMPHSNGRAHIGGSV